MTMLHLQTQDLPEGFGPGGFGYASSARFQLGLFDRIYLWTVSSKWASARLCALLNKGAYRSCQHRTLLQQAAAEVSALPDRLLALVTDLIQSAPVAATQDGARLLNSLQYAEYRRMRCVGFHA